MINIEIINTGDELRVIQGGDVLGAYMVDFVRLFTHEDAAAAGVEWWPQVLQAVERGPGLHTFRINRRFHRLIES